MNLLVSCNPKNSPNSIKSFKKFDLECLLNQIKKFKSISGLLSHLISLQTLLQIFIEELNFETLMKWLNYVTRVLTKELYNLKS